ncbi:PQQ-dependent sugar dehydrogenase [Streptomyces sp. NPDC047043]|uniref:PQQ-dependent sugar dehydrogenase n=1 Tax=Streptomyces sp. NPDC047043 TaxID=3154497 RepID=UPI0033FB5E6E
MSDPGRPVRRPSRFVLASLAAAAALLATGLSQPAPAAAVPPTTADGDAVTADTVAMEGGAPADVTTFSTGWQTPWDITFMPDGRSALVTERLTYQVYRLGLDGKRTDVGEVPNTVPEPYDDGPGGLLGVEPSPTWDGKKDKQVFFVHTTKTQTQIVRMDYDGKKLSHYKTLITGIKRIGNHNGGQIKFGPDGYLYVTTGDAYTPNLAQDKKSLNGKILRITKTGAPAPGNPFGDRIYSYGHRNPEGLAWDRNGRLWEAEVGDQTWDEVNLIKPGANYGFPVCEGACDHPGMTNPTVVFHPEWGVPSQVLVINNVLYVSSLRGKRLWRIPIVGDSEYVGTPVDFFPGKYGRLRAMAQVPGKDELLLGTSDLGYGKDKILRVSIK